MSDLENIGDSFSKIIRDKQISKFFANELLFEYISNRLSEVRFKEVDSVVQSDKSLKAICASLKEARAYCDKLSEIKVSKEILDLQVDGVIQAKIKSVAPNRWPTPIKWGLEALVVSCAVAIVAVSLFWSNLQSLFPKEHQTTLLEEKVRLERETNTHITDRTEIAEFQKNLDMQKKTGESVEQSTNSPAYTEETKLSEERKSSQQTPPAKVSSNSPVAESSAKIAVPVVVSNSQIEKAEGQVAKTKTTEVATSKPVVVTSKPKGYVYKLFMKLDNLDAIGPEITARIEELGGEKAGEVELGWKKPNGRYYHFIIPKANYGALQESLKAYGPVSIVKDPHDRVMPSDQERYILWIEGQ